MRHVVPAGSEVRACRALPRREIWHRGRAAQEIRVVIDPLVVGIPTVFYGLAVTCSAIDLWRSVRPLRVAALVLAGLALIARLATMLQPGLCPVTAGGSGMVVALFLALYLIISHPYETDDRARLTLLLAITLLLDLSGHLFGAAAQPVSPPPHERALGELHGGLILLAYACFLIASLNSALYLVLYRLMKQRRLGFWFRRLPSLQHLELKSARATLIGMGALTLGLAVGLYSFAVFHGGVPYDNIKFVVAMLVWLVFGVDVVLRRGFGFCGIRVMWVPVVGMAVILLLYSVGGGHPFWSPR